MGKAVLRYPDSLAAGEYTPEGGELAMEGKLGLTATFARRPANPMSGELVDATRSTEMEIRGHGVCY